MVLDEELDRAAAVLRQGGLVVMPTETVYGLAANALDAEAVKRIYEVKGRPATSPLIVHVAAIEMARSLARCWPEEANVLAGRYWPGPLTLVVPKRPVVPDVVTAGLDTVALRMPAHPVARELIRRATVPLAAPSANRFTQLSPTTAEHARASLGDQVDLILDGGPCQVGIESTVVSLTGDPLLLRPGMISLAELERLLGRPVKTVSKVEGPHPSPGLHERHYAPRTPLLLLKGEPLPAGRGAYLYWSRPQRAALQISMPATAEGYAKRLYEELHRADAAGLDWIAVETPPDEPEWWGITDRLRRAAAK
ncbi:MAG: L-threonylcarbamoyladenylate synthase [Bryobacteraceae bacterium]|nr:L-threonylcarbamoyladenylate synthase [Bryobacteraceae bacterium]MDW8379788.1 L-threonylcarbamoyladenylate synthase [Bryobacterales bacterium]